MASGIKIKNTHAIGAVFSYWRPGGVSNVLFAINTFLSSCRDAKKKLTRKGNNFTNSWSLNSSQIAKMAAILRIHFENCSVTVISNSHYQILTHVSHTGYFFCFLLSSCNFETDLFNYSSSTGFEVFLMHRQLSGITKWKRYPPHGDVLLMNRNHAGDWVP